MSGRKINNKMGKHISESIIKILFKKKLDPKNCNALILGVTFKENCSDIRNSRVFNLYKSLTKNKIDVELYDPHANSEEVFRIHKVNLISKIEKKYDVIVLAVAHTEFLKMNLLNFKNYNGIIYDVKSVLDKKIISARL